MEKSATHTPNRSPLSSGLGEITARKQAEETLLKAGALQNAIFNSANFSSIATDAKGVIQIFNVGAERMLGYAAADVMNKITPADISDPQEVIARAKALSVELGTPIAPGFDALVFKASRGIEDIYELTYIRKDGSRFPAIVSVTALRDADNEIIGYLLIGTDNTARKRAEEALLKAGALQKAIFDSANFSSIATDAKGVIQIFNVGAERMLGYAAADVMNKITPADISDPQEVIARAEALSVELGTPITPGFEALVFKASRGIEDIYELTYIRKDGSRFPAVVSVTALRDADNEIIGYLLIGTDNTARKQAEVSLRNSDTQLQTIVENLTEGIAVSDLDGQLLYFNRAALDLHGFTTLGECRQHLTKFADTFELSAMDGTVWTLDQWPLARVLRGENLRDLEVRVRHIQAGWQRVFNYGGTLVRDAGGQPLMAILTISDITERKQAEAKILATQAELQGLLNAANQTRRAMLSVAQDQKRAEESLRQLNAELEDKIIARTADLDKARHDAEAANQAKSSFLASMSHEIRTPMNGVIGMIDVLQQSSLNSSQMESANIIHDSAYSLLAIINDILDFSKIEAGKLQIDSLPMSVADVVEGACETIDHLALKKNVELTLFTDPDIPAAVIGDAGRLRQILINLANNAIKFSSGPDRQGKVSVRALLVENSSYSIPVRPEPFDSVRPELVEGTSGAQDRLVEGLDGSTGSHPQGARTSARPRTIEGNLEQVTLEFRVTDNGIGMDEATQARLFTAFTQADSSTTRIYGGTGLGLAISGQLANIMGGKITVQSEPGKGSMFSVRLSFKLAPDVGRMSPSATLRTGSALSAEGDCRKALRFSDLQGLPCLVVGTSESLADDLAAYLVRDGAVVERVVDLAAAREWIASCPPGLCIVVIDTAGSNPSLATSLLDGLRAAARTHPKQQTRFVAIGRGQRREPRLEGADLVAVDGNALTRRTLLKAVAIAAGRAKQPDRESLPGDAKVILTPLSREEAKRRGSLILIAEDNEINQKVIQQQLTLLGNTADIANNGREALELWRSGDYAILITDLHMPEMDGYELTAAIRAAEIGKLRIPIIAFTANALKGEAEHCLDVGMDDYLSKPVQLVNLKAMLDKWMPVGAEATPIEPCSPHDNAGNIPGFHPGYIAPTAVPVDVNVLKKLVGDDEEIIRDFLHDFRLSAAKIAAELRTACASGETAEAGALAHKLKSSARSVGALALGELCAEMEKSGKAGDMATLAMLLPKFEQELVSVEGFLEGY